MILFFCSSSLNGTYWVRGSCWCWLICFIFSPELLDSLQSPLQYSKNILFVFSKSEWMMEISLSVLLVASTDFQSFFPILILLTHYTSFSHCLCVKVCNLLTRTQAEREEPRCGWWLAAEDEVNEGNKWKKRIWNGRVVGGSFFSSQTFLFFFVRFAFLSVL